MQLLKIGVNCNEYTMVGSRATCNPAPTDTDNDVAVYVPGAMYDKIVDDLRRAGASPCGNQDYGSAEEGLEAWRHGEDNYLLMQDFDYYMLFLRCTGLARHFNLMNKEDRYLLFSTVLDGEYAALATLDRRQEAPF